MFLRCDLLNKVCKVKIWWMNFLILQIIIFSLCKSLLVNVNKPWLHTWGRAQAYTSDGAPRFLAKTQALPGALTLSLHLSPAHALPTPATPPSASWGSYLANVCGTQTFWPPEKPDWRIYVLFKAKVEFEKRGKSAFHFCIYMRGKIWVFRLRGRGRGEATLSGLFMAFRCRHNLISKGK